MINDKTDEVIEKRFESLLNRYRIGLETLMTESDFIFTCFHLLYCKCHRIKLKQGSSHTDSPDWIKTEKQQ